MADNCNNKKISFRTMVATGALVVAVAVAVAALMGYIYPTKAEVALVKEEVKDDIAKHKIEATELKWEVKSMATRVRNIERRQIQMGENLTKLLDRLRVRPVDPPYLTPMPMRPTDVIPE